MNELHSWMNEYKLDESTFIGGWFIPESCCDELLETFKNNESKWEIGAVGYGESLDNTIKKSTEFIISNENHDYYLKNYLHHLTDVLNNYKLRFPYCDKDVDRWSIYRNIKIQHYKPGEGFYKWHSENDGYGDNKRRHLAFMTYLNNVEDGGTEFYHQKIKIPCKKGLTLIWPSAWTQLHRGIINNEKEKTIITGWYEFYE